jgi:hypothetical protein
MAHHGHGTAAGAMQESRDADAMTKALDDYSKRDGWVEFNAEHPIPAEALMDDNLELVWGAGPSEEGKYRFPPLNAHWMRSVHDHVFLRIEETPTQTHPFPHLYVRDVFPRDFLCESTRSASGRRSI